MAFSLAMRPTPCCPVPAAPSRTVSTRLVFGRPRTYHPSMRSPHAMAVPLQDLAGIGVDVGPDLLPSLPFIALLSTTLALGLVKLTAYSQLEVVRTAMLSRHVKNGGARVLQLGGTTRDLYYYPPKTVKVTVNGEKGVNKGLFEQAGMTVGIPTTATTLPLLDCLTSTPSASFDSVISFDQFGPITSDSELKSIASEIARVLKPGGTFIFYERLQDGGLAQIGSGQGCRLQVGDVISGLDAWDFCEWDTAAGELDRHDVGVAIKGMGDAEAMGGSVDGSAFEAMIRKARNKGGKKQ